MFWGTDRHFHPNLLKKTRSFLRNSWKPVENELQNLSKTEAISPLFPNYFDFCFEKYNFSKYIHSQIIYMPLKTITCFRNQRKGNFTNWFFDKFVKN